jgi:hypothetical protein
MTQDEPFWSPEEDEALRALARPEAPRPDAVDETAARLSSEGLLKGRSGPRRFMRMAVAAALLAAAFGAGRAVGPLAREHAPVEQPRYVLLLYTDTGSYDPALEPKRVEEYRAWAGGLHRAGALVDGEKLSDTRLLLGPAEPAIQPVAGYFILQAGSLDEAANMARGCPHLKYGGRIELRPVDPT